MEDDNKGIEKALIDVYPKFLDAVKDTYPLAFLGSFSILVATFLQHAPNAQEYAIAAAVNFLLAFVLSLVVRLVPSSFLMALLLYISFGIGVVLLIAAAYELSEASFLSRVVVESTMRLFATAITFIIFWNWTTSIRGERFKKLQEQTKYPYELVVAFLVGSLGLLVMMVLQIFSVYSLFSRIEIPDSIQDLGGFAMVLIVISLIGIFIVSRLKRT